MRAAKVQASLRIRAVSPEPLLLAHISSESSGTFRQKARSLASLNGWPCAVKTCRDGMLEDTNSLDGAHISVKVSLSMQVVNMQFVNGATAALQMVAFTEKVYARKTRFYGTKVNIFHK